MKRKRKTQLPRVTLLAYSRRDLLAFVEAVESLRLIVEDLRILLEPAKRRRRAKADGPLPTHDSEGVPL